MDITWLGHCCFLLRGSSLAVLTDPCGPATGYNPGKVQADVVTVSARHPDHNHTELATGSRKVFSGPGEYEVSDMFVAGIMSARDAAQGAERGRNTIYKLHMDGIVLCHLGAIGHIPTSEQVTAIGDVDVLFVPVGGGGSLSPAQANEAVALLEPKMIVPMLYRTTLSPLPLEPVDAFLKEQGASGQEPTARLSVTKTTLAAAAGPQVVLLEPRPGR